MTASPVSAAGNIEVYPLYSYAIVMHRLSCRPVDESLSHLMSGDLVDRTGGQI